MQWREELSQELQTFLDCTTLISRIIQLITVLAVYHFYVSFHLITNIYKYLLKGHVKYECVYDTSACVNMYMSTCLWVTKYLNSADMMIAALLGFSIYTN